MKNQLTLNTPTEGFKIPTGEHITISPGTFDIIDIKAYEHQINIIAPDHDAQPVGIHFGDLV